MDYIDIEIRDDIPVQLQIAAMLNQVLRGLHYLKNEVRKMTEGIAALDAAVAQESTDVAAVLAGVSSLATTSSTAFADLLAKIAANPTAPVSDFTAEVTSLSANHTSLTNALASVNAAIATAAADDPGPQAVSTGDGSTGDGSTGTDGTTGS
jgi:hypothetical protein